MTETLPDLRALALAVEPHARAAGRAILEVYDSGDFRAEAKADASPLTEADRRSERVLQAGFAALDTGYLVVSEESRQLPYAERAPHETAWLVDPLDGTKEFLKRNGEFCVCVALCHRGAPVLGVVHRPVGGRSYLAWRGGDGVYVVDADGAAPAPLPRREPIDLQARSLKFCVSRSHLSPATEAYLADFDEPLPVAMGSALKFCGIAEGHIDVYPRLAPTMEWDTAAGQAIVEAVGGSVRVYPGDEPMRYNKEELVNPHFVATAPTR